MDVFCRSQIPYVVSPIAIKLDLQMFSRSKEVAREQPRLRRGLEPWVLTVTLDDHEQVE